MIREIKVITLRDVEERYDPMDHPEKLVAFWKKEVMRSEWYDCEKEQLVVLSLDSKLKVKTFNLVSIGLNNQTLVHAREVYRPAILSAAAHIVIMHNHPSGDPAPSADDVRVSREMMRAGEVLGIPCLDSLVVGIASERSPTGFASLKQAGLLI